MLQIDDAGWGCLVGGVVIGCYRIPEGRNVQDGPCFISGVVGPCYLQNDDREEPNRCARRRYLAAATEVVAACLARLKATPVKPVQIAPSPVLDGVRSWLSEAGYRWQPGRITGTCHSQLAQAWQLHLAELGFSAGIDLLTNPERAGLFWWRQVQWLKGGDVQAVARTPNARPSARRAGPPIRPGPVTPTARPGRWPPTPGGRERKDGRPDDAERCRG